MELRLRNATFAYLFALLVAVVLAALTTGCNAPQPKKMSAVEYLGAIDDDLNSTTNNEMRVYRVDTADGPLYIVRESYRGNIGLILAPKNAPAAEKRP